MPALTGSSDEPRSARVSRPRPRRSNSRQQSLRLQPDTLDTNVEAVIYCDAPVALPSHRVMATALDISIVVIALGIFLLTFHAAGGEVVLNRETIPFFGLIGVVFALFYHLLFCISGGDTAGMRWTQLRLVNFDGQIPDREQRIQRLAGTCVSILSAGLGLLWALVDEESLTWHDHMSKTFPSPLE